jgi:hypothetical protein
VSTSQIYLKGEFDLNKTYSYNDKNGDSLKLEKIKSNYLNFIPSKVVFNQKKVALIYTTNDNIYLRVVYDYENKKIFTFKYPQFHFENKVFHECFIACNKLGLKNYEIHKLDDPKTKINVLCKLNGNSNFPVLKREKINNFDCNIFNNFPNTLSETYWYTNQIGLPYFNFTNNDPQGIEDSLFCIKQFIRSDNIDMTYEIKNFTSNISEPELLSSDTFGFKSKGYVDQIYRNLCDSLRSVRTFPYIKNGGENANKVVNLINNGLCSEHEYDYLEKMSYDFYILLKFAFQNFKSTKYDSLNSILFNEEIITEDEYKVFNTYYKSSLINNLKYEDLIKIYAINKTLNQNRTKELIVEELYKLPMAINSNFINAISDFKTNNIDLSSLICAFDEINPLSLPKHIGSKTELITYIQSFVSECINECKIDVMSNKNGFEILVNNVGYSFKFSDFLDSESTEDDIFNLDHYHHDIILQRIKQISADNSIGYAYDINSFINLIDYDINEYSYYEIIKKNPDLRLFSNLYYIIKFKKTLYDPHKTINFSFKEKNYGSDKQLYLHSLFVGDVDAEIKYIRTDEKIKFFNLISKYQTKINLNSEQLQVLKEQLFSNLYADWRPMISKLNFSTFSISRITSDFPIIQNGKSFKTNFPSLFAFLGRYIKGENVQQYDIGPFFLTFYHDGRKVGVSKENDSKWESLLKKLDIILNTEQNISIYKFTPIGSFSNNFYLIDNDFAFDFINLFGNDFLTNIE